MTLVSCMAHAVTGVLLSAAPVDGGVAASAPAPAAAAVAQAADGGAEAGEAAPFTVTPMDGAPAGEGGALDDLLAPVAPLVEGGDFAAVEPIPAPAAEDPQAQSPVGKMGSMILGAPFAAAALGLFGVLMVLTALVLTTRPPNVPAGPQVGGGQSPDAWELVRGTMVVLTLCTGLVALLLFLLPYSSVAALFTEG